jgi:hypothetical protein
MMTFKDAMSLDVKSFDMWRERQFSKYQGPIFGEFIHTRGWVGWEELVKALNLPTTGEICVSSFRADMALFVSGETYIKYVGMCTYLFPCDMGSYPHPSGKRFTLTPTEFDGWYDEGWLVPERALALEVWTPEEAPEEVRVKFPNITFRCYSGMPEKVADLL